MFVGMTSTSLEVVAVEPPLPLVGLEEVHRERAPRRVFRRRPAQAVAVVAGGTSRRLRAVRAAPASSFFSTSSLTQQRARHLSTPQGTTPSWSSRERGRAPGRRRRVSPQSITWSSVVAVVVVVTSLLVVVLVV